jgi:hypothetical protein
MLTFDDFKKQLDEIPTIDDGFNGMADVLIEAVYEIRQKMGLSERALSQYVRKRTGKSISGSTIVIIENNYDVSYKEQLSTILDALEISEIHVDFEGRVHVKSKDDDIHISSSVFA